MKIHRFGTADYFFSAPNLKKDLTDSYRRFLESGIHEVFNKVFPIQDANKRYTFMYRGSYLGEVNMTPEEAEMRNETYSAPLRASFMLYDHEVKNSIETEVYMGDIPQMTEQGSFVYNGNKKAIVAQVVRANGVYLEEEYVQKTRKLKIKISPKKGSWLTVEPDKKGCLNVRIDDGGTSIPVTMLLKAMGFGDNESLMDLFNHHPFIENSVAKDKTLSQGDAALQIYQIIKKQTVSKEKAIDYVMSTFFDPKKYELGKTGRYKMNKKLLLSERVYGKTLSREIEGWDEGTVLTQEVLDSLQTREVFVCDANGEEVHVIGNNPSETTEVLTKEDILAAVNYCLYAEQIGQVDNIDHLFNRQIRLVGDVMIREFEKAMAAVERKAKEKLNTNHSLDANNKENKENKEELTPDRIIHIRPIINAMRDFLGSSQLSQNLDEVNVLSELEHKRRVSALGPGGFSKERAGLEVRDVNTSHYGRFCPIQTPEGQNIGLILSLANLARVNEYGLLETPYRVVDKKTGVATKEVRYLTAEEEERYKIARANDVTKKGTFQSDRVIVRYDKRYITVSANEVDYVDVSPAQPLSIATALIPFVHNDDPTRTVMGSNMQKQAVPLLRPQEPFVGTGMESVVAQDTNASYVAEESGVVVRVNDKEVVVRYDTLGEKRYIVKKFRRTSQDTCFNHRICVTTGERVQQGDVLIDSTSSNNGELALGQNALVAFMTWEGYNYEDAIIISERLVHDDVYTSVNMVEHVVDVREVKGDVEVVTCDVVGLGEDDVRRKKLDENGVVKVGSYVEEGDILVGKNTPKPVDETGTRERLVQYIFSEKSRHYKDSSEYVEHGEKGVVIDVQELTRENASLPTGVVKQYKITVADKWKTQKGDKMAGRHGNKGVISKVVPIEDMPYLEDGTPVDIMLNPMGVPSRMNIGQLMELHLGMSARVLNVKYKVPSFDGPTPEDIQGEFRKANLPENGKFTLYDGRTGEAFENEVTVGIMYMMKLDHLVENKMHARSVGPYSLVHQQPLGGKAQNGGQRLGEMEVWALEAYGAANLLQEMVTFKSDDIDGRARIFEDIVDGKPISKPNLPEAFNVLVRTTRALGLDIDAVREDGTSVYDRGLKKRGRDK